MQTIATACQFIDNLSTGNFAQAAASFDQNMSTAMPKDQLQAGWEQVERIGGKFHETTEVKIEPVDGQPGYTAVFLTLKFDVQSIQAYLIYESGGKVAGMGFAAA
jgi:uncharacterized protein DUF3887